jgi:hypothetical protein
MSKRKIMILIFMRKKYKESAKCKVQKLRTRTASRKLHKLTQIEEQRQSWNAVEVRRGGSVCPLIKLIKDHS